MDCSHVTEHHVADRYVLGQLTAEEAEGFEDHYMSCDTCLDELDRAEVMARGFKRMGAEETAKAAVVAAAGAGWWRRHRTWIPLAAVAVVAALAVPILLPRAPQGSNRVNTPVLYLQPERSSQAPPSRQLRIPADRGPIVLVLELDPPFHPSYTAVVERAGQKLWEGENLDLGERDTVTLSLDADLLSPGDHLLRLDAATPDGRRLSVGRFGFRVLE